MHVDVGCIRYNVVAWPCSNLGNCSLQTKKFNAPICVCTWKRSIWYQFYRILYKLDNHKQSSKIEINDKLLAGSAKK